jgi:hypothetical protein
LLKSMVMVSLTIRQNRLYIAGFCLTLARTVLGGNVCLSTMVAAGLEGSNVYRVAFAAGSPCEEGRSYTLTDTLDESWCSVINRNIQFEMCGQLATLVNRGESIGHGNDCGAVISIEGTEYSGRSISDDEEDPCAGDCNIGIAFGTLGGLKVFEGVPMCD